MKGARPAGVMGHLGRARYIQCSKGWGLVAFLLFDALAVVRAGNAQKAKHRSE